MGDPYKDLLIISINLFNLYAIDTRSQTLREDASFHKQILYNAMRNE